MQPPTPPVPSPPIPLPPTPGADSEGTTGVRDTRLGELLVRRGLISESSLRAALRVQGKLSNHKPLGEILVEQKVITPRQLDWALNRYRKRSRLGEILLRSGAITEDQLNFALAQQRESELRLGEILVKLNLVTEQGLRQALCAHFNVPLADLDKLVLDPALSTVVSKEFAKRHRILAIAQVDNSITVAMEDPANIDVIEELESWTGRAVHVVAAAPDAFARGLARLYGDEDAIRPDVVHRLELISTEATPERGSREYAPDSRQAEEIVRKLIALAMEWRASDIHLETLEGRVQTRLRIDGELRNLDIVRLQEAINTNQREVISRIKILGGLDIAERRRPQDGSFRARLVKNNQVIRVNVRVSVIPGYHGEAVVLRILDPRRAPTSLDGLGFSSQMAEGLGALLRNTAGMMLLTGPTGCGKSTTLYAALMGLGRPGIRILTVEDPIEYVFESFSQCEVNERIGNTFARFLRSFLRHDPEVIMVGEIRDDETAEMAFRAAQTGHLVLSTLHATDAVGAIARLQDLRVDRSLITACLLGVMSQRLIRTTCTYCQEPYVPADDLMREFFDEPPVGIRWSHGRGCSRCHFSGYLGRTAVGELWIPSDQDIRMINKDASVDELRRGGQSSTLLMVDDVKERLFAGQTTLEELIRMLPYRAVHQFRRLQGDRGHESPMMDDEAVLTLSGGSPAR